MVHNVADPDKSLSFGILVDEKIDDAQIEVMYVLFKKVVRNKAQLVLASSLNES